MNTEFNIGTILIDTEGQPFLHDGRKIGDCYGCLIGYSDGILCRSNGIDRFQKKTVGIAPHSVTRMVAMRNPTRN